MNEEKKVIDLDKFSRGFINLPPTRHVVNKTMGGFLIHSIKDLAMNFYREKHNLDEYQLLLAMQSQYPHESEGEYSYALHRARQIFSEFTREYQTGLIHGVPCSSKTVHIYDDVFLEGKPTLIAENTEELYLIKTFALRCPIRENMPDLFSQAVGMFFLFPSYRIWLIGFAPRSGRMQAKIVEPSPTDRDRFVSELKKYVEKRSVKI